MEPEPDAAATESMAAHLISMRIAEGPAHSYAAVLVEQGYDTAALFDEIDPDELKRCACTLCDTSKAWAHSWPAAPGTAFELLLATALSAAMVRARSVRGR